MKNEGFVFPDECPGVDRRPQGILGTTNWSETPEQVRMTHQRRHRIKQARSNNHPRGDQDKIPAQNKVRSNTPRQTNAKRSRENSQCRSTNSQERASNAHLSLHGHRDRFPFRKSALVRFPFIALMPPMYGCTVVPNNFISNCVIFIGLPVPKCSYLTSIQWATEDAGLLRRCPWLSPPETLSHLSQCMLLAALGIWHVHTVIALTFC